MGLYATEYTTGSKSIALVSWLGATAVGSLLEQTMAEPTYALEAEANAESVDRGVKKWACTCILCRLIAIPIFRRLAREVEAEEQALEEEKALPAEVAKEISTSVSKTEAEPVEKEKEGKDLEAIVSRIVEEFDKKVVAKVNSIEKELEAVKNEFSSVVNDLKNAIIEVRSSVSELANPFNYMRKYAEIVDESGKLLQLLAQLQASARQQQEAPQPTQALQQLAPIIAQLPAGEELKMLLSSISSGMLGTAAGQRPSHFARILRLIRWIDENLVGVPKEVIDEIMTFATESGLISEKERNLLFSAIRFVEELRKRGVGIREQLIMLYTIVKMLGVEDREADNELLKMIIEEGRKVHGGVQP